MSDWRPIICIDFDGVIHAYSKGWNGGKIYDDIVPGFIEWADEALELFELVIYSSRSKEPTARHEMQEWLKRHIDKAYERNTALALSISDFEFAYEKPPAFLTIDDRAICFSGDWASLDPEKLRAFKPWNMKTHKN